MDCEGSSFFISGSEFDAAMEAVLGDSETERIFLDAEFQPVSVIFYLELRCLVLSKKDFFFFLDFLIFNSKAMYYHIGLILEIIYEKLLKELQELPLILFIYLFFNLSNYSL